MSVEGGSDSVDVSVIPAIQAPVAGNACLEEHEARRVFEQAESTGGIAQQIEAALATGGLDC